MDEKTLRIYDESLRRCNAKPGFLDRFYETFLDSSPEVKQRFAHTDFSRQKRALRASLHLLALAAQDGEKGSERYLKDMAATHSKAKLDIGARLYDLWLDSILSTVRQFDPECSPEVEAAWESVMMVGINYMLAHYNTPAGGA